MNGAVRERNWLDWMLGIPMGYLRLLGLEGDRISSRAAQIVLTMVCVAGAVTTRLVQAYVAPPWISFDLGAVFLYLPTLACPWAATIPIIVAGVATSNNPLVALLGLGGAVQLSYFSSRLLERCGLGKYRLLAMAFGSTVGLLIGAIYFAILGLVPLKIGVPLLMARNLINISVCAATVPVIWHFLRRKGLI